MEGKTTLFKRLRKQPNAGVFHSTGSAISSPQIFSVFAAFLVWRWVAHGGRLTEKPIGNDSKPRSPEELGF